MTIFESAMASMFRSLTGIAEDIKTYQMWYDYITEDEAGRKEYTFPFVDMLYDVDNPKSATYAFTEPQLQNLREAICKDCERDLLPFLKSPTVDPAVWERLAEYYFALQVFGPPKDPNETLVIYTLLCIALDRHREARDCARQLAANPDDDGAKALLQYAEDHMSLPRFHAAFLSRSQNAWIAASASIQQYNSGKIDQLQLNEQVYKVFRIWTELPAIVDILSPKKGSIVFTPEDWLLDLYSVRASIYAGLPSQPNELKGDWGGFIGASSHYEKVILGDDTEVSFSDIITAVVDNAAHNGARIKIHCPAFSKYVNYGECNTLFTHAVERILGAADYCTNVRDVEYVRSMSRKPTGTLDTLAEQLEAAGYTSGHDIDDVAPIRMRRAYRRPQTDAVQRLRDDIRTGETICWALQEDYENNRTGTADHYMNRGIAPVFLAWPRSIMDCGEEAFTQNLVDALNEGDAPYNVQVLGKASGTQYCYLDLLAWSPLYLVELVEQYFAQIPGGDAVRMQSFYYDAYPCPVSIARTQEHCSLGGEDQPTQGQAPNGKPPAARPKEKKKNAAKAKRKHSKKYR